MVWRTDGKTAWLELVPLSGRLDRECLAAGIVGLSIGDWPVGHRPRPLPAEGGLPGLRVGLLGLELPGEAGPPPSPAEWYARQHDLVAWFSAGADRPVEVQAIWRGVAGGKNEAFAAAVDLIIGVRTQCVETDAGLTVVSSLPASQGISVGLPQGGAAGPWSWANENTPAAAYLFRLGAGWSYAEMVHPATRLQSQWGPTQPGVVEVRHRLFAGPAERLEKGVLLRAWVRGALVPEGDDVRRAGCIYAALAASEPPLDT